MYNTYTVDYYNSHNLVVFFKDGAVGDVHGVYVKLCDAYEVS